MTELSLFLFYMGLSSGYLLLSHFGINNNSYMSPTSSQKDSSVIQNNELLWYFITKSLCSISSKDSKLDTSKFEIIIITKYQTWKKHCQKDISEEWLIKLTSINWYTVLYGATQLSSVLGNSFHRKNFVLRTLFQIHQTLLL